MREDQQLELLPTHTLLDWIIELYKKTGFFWAASIILLALLLLFIGTLVSVWGVKNIKNAKFKIAAILSVIFVALFFMMHGLVYRVIPNKLGEEKPSNLNGHAISPPLVVGNSNNGIIKLVKLYWDNPKSPKYLVYEYVVLSDHTGHNSTKMRVVMYDHSQKKVNDIYIKLPQEQLLASGDIREGLVAVPKNVTRANIMIVDQ